MDAAGAGPLSAPTAAPAAPDGAEARLRAAGVRVTRPRLAVLEALGHLGGHRGVDEIGAALARRGTPVPLTTIYNVVVDLSRAGLVLAADAGPGRALYEVAERRHHHFVCRSCGQVADVPGTLEPAPGLAADLAGAEVEEASVIYRGRCAACAGAGAGGGRSSWR